MTQVDNDAREEKSRTSGIKTANLWDWVKCICTVIFVGVCGFKILTVKTDLTVDFPTLLSLILAFFSILISALFYFKATESSNLFYDNTYKFTKDISQLLAKIESGFGEKLQNINDSNNRMQEQVLEQLLQQQASKSKELGEKEEEVEKNRSERDNLINELTEKAKLSEEEKDEYIAKFNQKDEEVSRLQNEIKKLKNGIKADSEELSFEELTELLAKESFRNRLARKMMTNTILPTNATRAGGLLSESWKDYAKSKKDDSSED
ncbi:hypothetical protein [Maridesulfovibrio salexigens]|uniref:Uncharacterized protein n=1 Tax=Maridesulfovibrio salexigens (strain ATCC 14822 / DSM 2638 / NCIMB 8403 / VKM B-1763) TaxID=526222 RepID=C6C1Y2_MARSD|nr:hypothetical protein [Maridesulfovibrio salexigens]ACS79378.1 hypothetical protein Desal_1316 [Maridesulfovibrio salexigens DSM 2638]